MRVVLVIIRLLLLVTAVVAIVGAFTVVGSEAGREFFHSNQNMWSGLLGLFVAFSAGISVAGAVSPRWILAHPGGALFALVPLVVLLLIRFYSAFDHPVTLNVALLGALFALLALLLQPAAALALRKENARRPRSVERERAF